MIYDTIVIGRGPAGISLAIYLKRFNYNPLVIAYSDGALGDAHYIDNYYGLSHIKGSELVEAGVKQAKELQIDMVDAEVTSVEVLDHIYVTTTNGNFEAKTLFLAMGKKKSGLKIPTAHSFDGSGVSYCAICDGFFFKGKKIGLVGAGAYMESEYNVLKRFSNDITIFTEGEDINISNVKIVKDKITELCGSDKLEYVQTIGEKYNIDGLFIALGTQSGASLASHLGLATDEKGYLIVDKNYMTNINHIYAGGDIIGGLLQVSKAVSDGANAAISIKKDLDINKDME